MCWRGVACVNIRWSKRKLLMPEGVAVDERKGTLPKSLSDTEVSTPIFEVVAPQLQKSQSARGLFIEDICATEGFAGDRLWLILANQVEDPVCLSFTLEEEGVPAEEVVQRDKLFTFTVPTLPFTHDRSVQLTLRSQTLHISIPFTYKTRSESNGASQFESLADFAATGEISSLILPFASHIGDRDSEGNTFALKLLLSALPSDKKDDVLNMRNTRGQTALHCAVRAGDPDSVHYLLSHGCGTRVLDNHRNSVIHYLADAYNEAIFKEILEAPGSCENDLDALNEEGFSALHLAVRRLKLSLIEMLLEAGASINSKDHVGRTALFHAVNMNDVEIVQFLLGKGADPNVEDESAETPLLLCMKTANYGIMGLLIDAGGDPKKQNRNGNSLSESADETVQRIIAGESKFCCFQELGCSHMIELISICSDDSSPTMILLDQFEQMPEAKISRVRSALHTLQEEESVKLIDDRFIY
ncbi:IKB-1 [Trichostrongylus colubriformis]|uniref:IKB-1 n=1 Tax=Trichostrongylus colubriformis TaxID=6319 RepID=A0AAN8FL23_TRICO